MSEFVFVVSFLSLIYFLSLFVEDVKQFRAERRRQKSASDSCPGAPGDRQ